jgi:hypothetical protein
MARRVTGHFALRRSSAPMMDASTQECTAAAGAGVSSTALLRARRSIGTKVATSTRRAEASEARPPAPLASWKRPSADRGGGEQGMAAAAHAVGSPAESLSHVGSLPDEMLEHVFLFLDIKSLMTAVPGVCKRWRSVC